MIVQSAAGGTAMQKSERELRGADSATAAEERVRRFPHLLGGSRAFRSLSPERRIAHLQGESASRQRRMLSVKPAKPVRAQPFRIELKLPSGARKADLVRLEVRLPSGKTQALEHAPSPAELGARLIRLEGFRSGSAGELYVSSRVYFEDGSTVSDATLASVFSRNPDQLVVTPRAWLVSGRAGRVEYDWDTDEFHCRAYGSITNGSTGSRTFRTCRVRVTDGGVSGTLISEFAFAIGPFTVQPGASAFRTIDTWYPRGGSVWDKFNQRWDLTVRFTYEADGGAQVSDAAVYRPMSTVPLNPIKTTDFTAGQTTAERNAVAIAAELLEDRDVTLFGPNWQILSNQADKDRFGIIDIDWASNYWDFDEAQDMYEQISGPEQDRLDMFVPLGFAYTADVPADKRNVGGFSTENGPYPKDGAPRRSACLVLLDENDQEFFGVAVAHELCHYLGLGHVESTDNLMHRNGGTTGHKLTWQQWDTIRQHGMMKWLAPDI